MLFSSSVWLLKIAFFRRSFLLRGHLTPGDDALIPDFEPLASKDEIGLPERSIISLP
jgi:hypothetical protein